MSVLLPYCERTLLARHWQMGMPGQGERRAREAGGGKRRRWGCDGRCSLIGRWISSDACLDWLRDRPCSSRRLAPCPSITAGLHGAFMTSRPSRAPPALPDLIRPVVRAASPGEPLPVERAKSSCLRAHVRPTAGARLCGDAAPGSLELGQASPAANRLAPSLAWLCQAPAAPAAGTALRRSGARGWERAGGRGGQRAGSNCPTCRRRPADGGGPQPKPAAGACGCCMGWFWHSCPVLQQQTKMLQQQSAQPA